MLNIAPSYPFPSDNSLSPTAASPIQAGRRGDRRASVRPAQPRLPISDAAPERVASAPQVTTMPRATRDRTANDQNRGKPSRAAWSEQAALTFMAGLPALRPALPRLRAARQVRHLTQRELAQATGVRVEVIRHLEAGVLPEGRSPEQLRRDVVCLAAFLDVPVQRVFPPACLASLRTQWVQLRMQTCFKRWLEAARPPEALSAFTVDVWRRRASARAAALTGREPRRADRDVETVPDPNALAVETILDFEALRDELTRALEPLPAIQRCILQMRYGWDTGIALTVTQVAEQLDLSPNDVRHLEERGFRLLRKSRDRMVELSPFLEVSFD